MRPAFLLAVLLTALTAALAAGCATPAETDPKPVSGDAAYPDLLMGPDAAREIGYSIQWQTPLALPGRVTVRHAELIDKQLVVIDSENVAYVIDANSGQRHWSAKIGTDLERFSKPTIEDGNLIMCSETRAYVYNLRTGEESRTIPLYYGSNTRPVILDGLMIHGNGSGYVFAQDIDRGIRVWQYKFPGAVSVDPVTAGAGVVVATSSGYVGMFEPRTGTLLWQQRTFDKVSADPIGTDLMVYVACEDRSMYAFERNTGTLRWRYFSRDPLMDAPALTVNKLLVNVPSRGLVAVDAFTGEEAWVSALPRARFIQTVGDMIHVLSGGKLHMVNAATGEVYQSTALPGIDRVISDAPDKAGNLYVVDNNSGKVMKLSPR